MVFGTADLNCGHCDMNRYTPMPFMCTSSTRKCGGGGGSKGRPVKIITDNSVETIVFGNNEYDNDSLNAV
jgi:hypothetical protein